MATRQARSPLAPAATISYSSDVQPVKQVASQSEFGELIDLGQVAPVIVGESKLELVIDKAALKADKHVAKELDVSPKDVDKAVQKAATVS